MTLRFAVISIVLALVIVLLARLPRPVLVLVVASFVGAVVGVVVLVSHSFIRMCDFSRARLVDTCSGTYVSLVGEHRLPQFTQGPNADAWLIGTAALAGAVLADLFALWAMWTWSRMRRGEAVASPT
jgi:hypothetical protein